MFHLCGPPWSRRTRRRRSGPAEASPTRSLALARQLPQEKPGSSTATSSTLSGSPQVRDGMLRVSRWSRIRTPTNTEECQTVVVTCWDSSCCETHSYQQVYRTPLQLTRRQSVGQTDSLWFAIDRARASSGANQSGLARRGSHLSALTITSHQGLCRCGPIGLVHLESEACSMPSHDRIWLHEKQHTLPSRPNMTQYYPQLPCLFSGHALFGFA
jgi:hypothetical protein